MQDIAQRIQNYGHTYIEKVAHFYSLGVTYCERLNDANLNTTRTFLTQLESDCESILRGNYLAFVNASGRIALDYLDSVVACGTDLNRNILAKVTHE